MSEFDPKQWPDVEAAYRRLPNIEPPAALDAAVLAAARAAVAKPAARARWLVPVSAAATAVLAIGLAFQLRERGKEPPWSEVVVTQAPLAESTADDTRAKSQAPPSAENAQVPDSKLDANLRDDGAFGSRAAEQTAGSFTGAPRPASEAAASGADGLARSAAPAGPKAELAKAPADEPKSAPAADAELAERRRKGPPRVAQPTVQAETVAAPEPQYRAVREPVPSPAAAAPAANAFPGDRQDQAKSRELEDERDQVETTVRQETRTLSSPASPPPPAPTPSVAASATRAPEALPAPASPTEAPAAKVAPKPVGAMQAGGRANEPPQEGLSARGGSKKLSGDKDVAKVVRETQASAPAKEEARPTAPEALEQSQPTTTQRPAPTPVRASERLEPKAWVGAIRRQLDAGQRDVALAELRALRQRFPRFELPPDLAQVLREAH
jgi:hypothetical protein